MNLNAALLDQSENYVTSGNSQAIYERPWATGSFENWDWKNFDDSLMIVDCILNHPQFEFKLTNRETTASNLVIDAATYDNSLSFNFWAEEHDNNVDNMQQIKINTDDLSYVGVYVMSLRITGQMNGDQYDKEFDVLELSIISSCSAAGGLEIVG